MNTSFSENLTNLHLWWWRTNTERSARPCFAVAPRTTGSAAAESTPKPRPQDRGFFHGKNKDRLARSALRTQRVQHL